jgi:hypothetical protein
MKSEAELFKMRDEAEKHYNRRRGRSDLWAKMRLLNEILEEDYPGETRRMAKVKREKAEEDLADLKNAGYIVLSGADREGYRQIAEAAKKGRELFEKTELAQVSPEYIPVPEGILARKYREARKELDER